MDGERWEGRVEHYLTDPSLEPDPARWLPSWPTWRPAPERRPP